MSSGAVQVLVIDTGMGIPEVEISRLGEQFYRGSNAVASQVGGTGLGLRIVYSILKQHGGTISVTSPVGQGTPCLVRLAQRDAEIQTFLGS